MAEHVASIIGGPYDGTQIKEVGNTMYPGVKCPVCLAEPGKPCRSTNMRRPGLLVSYVHRGRKLLAS